jgi:flagellin-like protein
MLFKTQIKQTKKGVSPLIATILLIVVAVILVTLLLTWGRDFVLDTASHTDDILSQYKEADLSFYIKVFRAGNGRIIVDYFPPSTSPLQDLNFVGYGLLGYTDHIVPFEPPVVLEANKNGQIIDHGIMLDQFDLLLYTDDGYVITKRNIRQENLQPHSCPEGYVPVPGNHLYGTAYQGSHGFCVMKYEAKVDTTGDGKGDLAVYNTGNPAIDGNTDYCKGRWGTGPTYYHTWCHLDYHNGSAYVNCPSECYIENYSVVSSKDGYPIAHIQQSNSSEFDAKNACESIPGGHLITNNEWMTIVRNIELVSSNWSSEEVGVGYLPRGNTNLGRAAYGNDPEGTGITKRTLTLTNNQIIWDLSGNVYSWTDDSIQYKDQPDGFHDINDSLYTGLAWFDYSKGGGVSQYLKWNDLGSTTMKYKDLFLFTNGNYKAMLPNNSTVDNGIGRIYISSDSTSTSTRVFARGGNWASGTDAGVLALYLSVAPTNRHHSRGFRCLVVSQ